MGICGSASNDIKKSMKGKEPKGSSSTQKGTIDSTQNQAVLRNSRISNEKDIAIGNNNFISLSTGLPLDNYISDKKLGEGSYGQVFRVKHRDIGVYRAMKKISAGNNKDEEKIREITNEIELMKAMDHPSIAKIFEFYNTKDGFFLITEYCSGGELFDKILKLKRLGEVQTAYIMYQIISAVFYCHNMNIIHRDLKPENILIDSEEKDNFLNIKVIDFGTAKLFDKSKTENKVIGSAYYIAPEVLNGKYNEKCDVWSCGVIMYILLTGKPPFGGEDHEIIEKIKKGKFDLKLDPWPTISTEAKDLIKSLLETNYLNRIPAQKALTHKWFQKFKMRERFTSVGVEKLKKTIENLKHYKTQGKLQQAALAFLVHNSLYLPEVKDLVRIFQSIDQNGDGKITKEELAVALSKIYNIPDPEEEVNEVFLNVDNDNNGYIEYEEYLRASIDKNALLTDDIMKFAFKYFDKDGSGAITADEVALVLFPGQDIRFNEQLTLQLLNEVDLDKNAQITYDEFKDMMKKLLL